MDEVDASLDASADSAPSNNLRLWRLLDQTRCAIANARELELAQFGLTLPKSAVLFTLYANGGTLTLGEISELTMRRHHSVSTLVRRMADLGLVETTKKQPDDNKKRVVITPKGREVLDRSTASSIEMIFSALSAEEKHALGRCLVQLQEKARSMLTGII